MRTFAETLSFLYSQLPMYQRDGNAAIKKDLSNTIALCEILGNPQKQFKSIHIAGTNGKGSTAHMLASIFQEAGYKTALYTSPHLKDFRERVKINGEMISEEEVIHFVEENQWRFEGIRPSFFEWTVALAFHYFAQEKVDIAIIETGLGGRLDSTNVISPLLSVITNIGWDHMDMLGDTLEKIAFEKAGIIKENTPVVIGNDSGVKNVFEAKCQETRSSVVFAENYSAPVILGRELHGNYQHENIRTVYTAWLTIRKHLSAGLAISYPQFVKGICKTVSNTNLRGRWEILGTQPKIIADVGHNEAGLKYIIEQIKEEEYAQLHIVLGVVKEKDFSKILPFFPKEAKYYFCAANIPRSLDAKSLQLKASQNGLIGETYASVDEAVNAAKTVSKKEDLIYIGGSTFVVAEAL